MVSRPTPNRLGYFSHVIVLLTLLHRSSLVSAWGRHVPTHLEGQLSAVFILACGGGGNAMIPGVMLWGGDCGVNVQHTLEL